MSHRYRPVASKGETAVSLRAAFSGASGILGRQLFQYFERLPARRGGIQLYSGPNSI
jgi:hypothetical protein